MACDCQEVWPEWKITFPESLTEEELLLKSKYASLKKMKQKLLHYQTVGKCMAPERTNSHKKTKIVHQNDTKDKKTSDFKKPLKHQQNVSERNLSDYSFDEDLQPRSVTIRGKNLTDSYLRSQFGKFGFIWKIRINENQTSSVLTFKRPSSAIEAANALNGSIIDGIELVVSVVKPKNTSWCDISSSDNSAQTNKRRERSVYLAFKGRLTAKDIENFFETVGRETRIYLNEMKGYGFVVFENKEQAGRAVKEMNGEICNGIKVTVSPQRFLDTSSNVSSLKQISEREEVSYGDVEF